MDTRALYPDSSFADFYDELIMPPKLRKVHQDNDKAVMAAGYLIKGITDSKCMAEPISDRVADVILKPAKAKLKVVGD